METPNNSNGLHKITSLYLAHYENIKQQSSEMRAKGLQRHSLRITHEEYLRITTEDDRNLLRFELNCAAVQFLENNRPVYLESLGIIYPETVCETKSHTVGSFYAIRNETLRHLRFEKCDDIIGLPAEVTTKLAQTRELASRIYPRLPLVLQVKWTFADLQGILRVMVTSLRQKIIRAGHSSILSSVGDFYALHNRQGSTSAEWYAGADIFLKQRGSCPIAIGKSRLLPRPILKDAWELLVAAYGEPIKTYSVDVLTILKQLGYAYDEQSLADNLGQQNEVQKTIKVAAFAVNFTTETIKPASILYCTDGLRSAAEVAQAQKSTETDSSSSETKPSEKRRKAGTEIVFQLPFDRQSTPPEDLPALVAEALVMGWILMHGTKSRALKIGTGLSSRYPLGGDPSSQLNSVIVTTLTAIKSENLADDGPFYYMNIVGVTADEASFIKEHRKNHLIAALESRGLDQITQPKRSSVFARTEIEVPMAMAS